MRIYKNNELGVIDGATIDPFLQSTGEPAPSGVTMQNYMEWILVDNEWIHDAGKAALARNKQPFESWTWNSETFNWEPPVEMPEDGEFYEWDEDSTSWILTEAE